jgi:hypothetical protein
VTVAVAMAVSPRQPRILRVSVIDIGGFPV